MSLRLRLIILPILVLVVGLGVLALTELGAARERIQVETQAGMQVGRSLIADVLDRRRGLPPESAMAGLREDLPDIRHVKFAVGPLGQPRPEPTARGRDVPGWFVTLVAPKQVVERFRVAARGNQSVGEIVMIPNPSDEVREIWDDWRDLVAVLLVLTAVTAVVMALVVGSGLRPLQLLADGLDRLGEGDLNVSLAPVEDVELRRVGQRFNRLVLSLNRATEDNRLLISRLMSLQEAERKEIAQELHDEFGPALFGIRAELGSIAKLAKADPPRTAEIELRVREIGGLVEQIQRINSGMLERLRPLVLDEMGLAAALNRLIDGWAARYPDIRWRRRIARTVEVPEPIALALYRAVQECLTNVVRHAGASTVEVSLLRTRDQISVSVRDDGKGISDDARFGFGLLGMAERARALGGRLNVTAARGGGALIEVIHPLEAAQ